MESTGFLLAPQVRAKVGFVDHPSCIRVNPHGYLGRDVAQTVDDVADRLNGLANAARCFSSASTTEPHDVATEKFVFIRHSVILHEVGDECNFRYMRY